MNVVSSYSGFMTPFMAPPLRQLPPPSAPMSKLRTVSVVRLANVSQHCPQVSCNHCLISQCNTP